MEKGWKSSVRMTSASSRAWMMTEKVSPSPPDFFSDFSATLMSSSIVRCLYRVSARAGQRHAVAGQMESMWRLFDGHCLDDHKGLSKRKIVGDGEMDQPPIASRQYAVQSGGGPSGQSHGRRAAGQIDHAH